MRRVFVLFVLAAILAANITAFGAVNVTASRDYVDRKVEAVSNTLTKAIQDAEPGNYNIVSNKAMTAIQSLDPATNYANTAVGNLRTDLTNGSTTVKKASTLVTEGGVQKTAEQIISDISERTSTNDVRGIVTARSESGYTDWVISSDHEYLSQRVGDMKILPWSRKWNLYRGNLYGSDKMAGAQGNMDSTNLSWSVAFAPGEYGTVSATRSRISTNTLSLATYDDIDKVPSMTVARAETYGTKYRWTDSTGCVWQVSSDVWKDYWEITPKDRASGMCVFWDGDSWVFQYEGFTQDTGIGSSGGSFSVDALGVQCRRYPGGDAVLVTRLASTNDVESIAIDLARNKSLMWVSDMGILKCSHDCRAWVGNLNVNGNSIGVTLESNVDFFWMFMTYNGTRLRYDGGGTVSDETITLSNPWNEDAEEDADSYPFQSVTFRRREANGLGLPDFEDFDSKQDLLPYPTNQIPYSAIYNPPWLTSFTESDPTIYSWAKASTKPSYSWSEITSKPTFATVATSGSYSDLSGKPSLKTVATTGAYSDLTGKPDLKTVATSGNYSDLTGKPDLTQYVGKSDFNTATNDLSGEIFIKRDVGDINVDGWLVRKPDGTHEILWWHVGEGGVVESWYSSDASMFLVLMTDGVAMWTLSVDTYQTTISAQADATELTFTYDASNVYVATRVKDRFALKKETASQSDITNTVNSIMPTAVTNTVRSVVSVTSSYIWDAQEECLYRREMKAGYLYWTPVTNVNALLPENISVLNYLEEHKND